MRALIYKPNASWSTSFAFLCAVAVFGTAICCGRTSVEPRIVSAPPDDGGIPVTLERAADPLDVPPETDPDVAPTPGPDEDAFPEEKTEPKKVAAKKESPPIWRSTVAPHSGRGGSSQPGGSNLALYAPRPAYPYEARRQNAIGTGLASLTIDPATGTVTDARMQQSTGKAILDASALKAFARWRFRPGTAHVMVIPITFTLTGASY
jgi:TonB family protein